MTVEIHETDLEQATIVEVLSELSGSHVIAPAAIGATTLIVNDSSDFSELGGQVRINGVTYTYITKTEDPDTIVLAPGGLTVAIDLTEEAPRVDTLPESREKKARVYIESNGDVDWARIPSDLQSGVEEGMREEDARETVTLKYEGSNFIVQEILGQQMYVDGGYIIPGTVPIETSDGLNPVAVGALSARGGIRVVFLSWAAIENYGKVTYKVYGSTTSGIPVDGNGVPLPAYFIGEADATRFTADKAWNAVDSLLVGLTPDAPAFFKVTAYDEDGEGPASPEISASPTQITGPDIAAESITGDNIIGTSITAKHFDAEIVLASLIRLGLITLDGNDGISVEDPLRPERKTIISATGTGHQFVGQTTLDGADFLGQVNRLGSNNYLNGTETATSGVTDPSQAPSVTESYDFVTGSGGAGFNKLGLCDEPTGVAVVTTDTVGTIASNVQSVNKTNGAAFPMFDVQTDWLSLGGVTRIGNIYYVLCAHNDGGTWVKNNWRILKWNATTLGYIGSVGTDFTTGSYYPTIGNDGTNLLVALLTTANNLYVQTLDPVNSTGGIANKLSQASMGAFTGQHLTGISKTATGIISGNTRYVLSTLTGSGYYVYSTAGVRVSSDEVLRASSTSRGLYFDADDGIFYQTTGARVYKYTTLTGSIDAFYTWADTDTTAGSTTAETRRSPIKTITPKRWAKWTVSIPTSPPDDGTTDGANTAMIYIAKPSGGTAYRQTTLPDGVLTATYTAIATSGTAYVNANGFETRPTTQFGRFKSSKESGGNPIWDYKGTGEGRSGKYSWDADGVMLSDVERDRMLRYRSTNQNIPHAAMTILTFDVQDGVNQGITYSGGSFTIAKTGLYLMLTTIQFQAQSGGRRIAAVYINGVEHGRQEVAPSGTATATAVQCSMVRRLSAGAVVTFRGYQNNTPGTTLDINGGLDSHNASVTMLSS